MTTFAELGVNGEILKGLAALEFVVPTPIQEQIIPTLLAGARDVVGLAQTGTGKTAAFGIPLVQLCDGSQRQTQGLVLCPTRELCLQVTRDLGAIAKFVVGLRVTAVYGGAPVDGQIRELRRGAQIIVATPGRLHDLIRRRAVDLAALKLVVLDEADEMLQMGFQDELQAILAVTPADKNTLLFSATMPREVAAIAAGYMKNPVEVTVGGRNVGAENIRHISYLVQAKDRYPALRRIIDCTPGIYSIIFCRTRQDTKDVAHWLVRDGYNADALHGDLSQAQRDQVMGKFRGRHLDLLVATDVAARGLDVNDLTHVINYNLPDDLASYTHRSGRTGRAGKDGISIAFIHLREKHLLRAIENRLQRKFEQGRIPSGHEVCERQLFHLIDTVKQVAVDHGRIAPFLDVITEKLASLDREELIQRFVSMEFNRFLADYRDARDLNVSAKPGKERRPGPAAGPGGGPLKGGQKFDHQRERVHYARFRINIGKLDGMHATRLIGQINEATPGVSVQIGKIEIRDNEAFFEADSRFAELVPQVFQALKINGKDVVVGDAPAWAGKSERPGFKKAGFKKAGFPKAGGKKVAFKKFDGKKGKKGGRSGVPVKRGGPGKG